MRNSRPIIGITTGEIRNLREPWRYIVYGQTQPYVDAVTLAGGVVILLPIVDDMEAWRSMYDQCDGLLFAGGNDIEPKHYGQEPVVALGKMTPRRDAQELALMKWALEENKPILGICRGMQLLNVACGGSLIQDILAADPKAQDHDVSSARKEFSYVAHRLKLLKDSQLAKILRSTAVKANSSHHQAVGTLGNGVVATGRADDGIIETIELPDHVFAVGVESHPESMYTSTEPRWLKLFEAFVKAGIPLNP